MKTKLLFFLSFVLVGLSAQESKIGQVDSLNRQREMKEGVLNAAPDLRSEEEQVPEIIPGDREDMGPQYIVQKKQIRRWWDVKLDTQAMYTSNMLLQSNGWNNKAVDATLLASTAEFDFAPDPININNNALFPKIGFRHQWFNYGLGDNGSMFRYQGETPQDDLAGYNSFDYDAQTIFGSLNYVYDQKWIFGLGFDYTRLMTHENSDSFPQLSNYSETYKEYVPSVSVTRVFQITPITVASVGFDQKIRYTDQDNIFPQDNIDGSNRRELFNRIDSAVSLGLRQQIVPTVYAQPFFRFQYSNYNVNDHRNGLNFHNREDFTYTSGVGFSWDVTDWFSVSSFGSFEKRTSTSPRIEDYTKYDLGGGLSANFRF